MTTSRSASGARSKRRTPQAERRSPRRAGATGFAVTVAGAIAAVVAVAAYVPHLGAGFASEDFLILAHLSRESLATTAREELTTAWLGLESVGFWRPVSTLLLASELRAFGLEPKYFHLLHLLLHACNAFLVASIVVRVARPRHAPLVAAATAVLFAIHPFHPSAVLFTGAFATLYGATFSLIAILGFLVAIEGPRRRPALELCALASFVLALGSYEASVVVPVVLLVTVLLYPDTRRATARVLPFFVVLGVWLGVRQLVLGTPVGGYRQFRTRLMAPLDRAADVARTMRDLVHPAFDAMALRHGLVVAVAVGVLALGGVAAVVLARSRGDRSAGDAGRTVIAGALWIAIFLAPFAFVGLVPANGRYGYLAIAGVLLALAGLGAALLRHWPRGGAVIAVLAFLAVGADWLVLLRAYLKANDEASSQVETVSNAVLRVAAREPAGDAVILVEDPPHFVSGSTGAPLAKVLQYGLAEALSPPFGRLERDVVALPGTVAPETRAALGALPGVERWRWDAAARSLARVPASPAPPPALAVVAIDPAAGFLDASCDACDRARLIVVAPGMQLAAEPISAGDGRVRFAMPAAFLRGAARHQRGSVFFWIEVSQPGAAPALSPIGRFSLDGDPLRAFADAAAKIRGGRK